MSGSTNFPSTGFPFVDKTGRLTQQARQFFVAIYNRAGGSTTSATANETGNSSVAFSVARATTPAQAVPLEQYRSQAGQAPSSVAIGASPWTYTAPGNGSLIISGGTVSEIEIQRGGVAIVTGLTSGMFPLKANDGVIVLFSSVPQATWLPD